MELHLQKLFGMFSSICRMKNIVYEQIAAKSIKITRRLGNWKKSKIPFRPTLKLLIFLGVNFSGRKNWKRSCQFNSIHLKQHLCVASPESPLVSYVLFQVLADCFVFCQRSWLEELCGPEKKLFFLHFRVNFFFKNAQNSYFLYCIFI